MKSASQTHQDRRRQGFTLIEILTVIGLIAFLAGSTYMVVAGFTESAREAATKATLLKADEILRQRTESFDRFVDQSPDVQSLVNNAYSLLRFQYGDSPTKTSLEILLRKKLFSWHFPQSYLDVASAVGAVDPRTGREVIGSSGSIPANPNPPAFAGIPVNRLSVLPTVALLNYFYQINGANKWEPKNVISPADSSELLYFIISQTTFTGAPVVDTDRFTTAELRDTDGDGLQELRDSWEQPLRFYRWPTRLFRPAGLGNDERPGAAGTDDDGNGLTDDDIEVGFGGSDDGSVNLGRQQAAGVLIPGLPEPPQAANIPDMLAQDPDDPLGILIYEAAFLQQQGSNLQLWQTVGERVLHTPATYHTPLVISAGPDLQLGLFEPTPTIYDSNDSNFLLWQVTGRLAQPTTASDLLYDNLVNRNARPRNR